jgi:hypothetical protein
MWRGGQRAVREPAESRWRAVGEPAESRQRAVREPAESRQRAGREPPESRQRAAREPLAYLEDPRQDVERPVDHAEDGEAREGLGGRELAAEALRVDGEAADGDERLHEARARAVGVQERR